MLEHYTFSCFLQFFRTHPLQSHPWDSLARLIHWFTIKAISSPNRRRYPDRFAFTSESRGHYFSLTHGHDFWLMRFSPLTYLLQFGSDSSIITSSSDGAGVISTAATGTSLPGNSAVKTRRYCPSIVRSGACVHLDRRRNITGNSGQILNRDHGTLANISRLMVACIKVRRLIYPAFKEVWDSKRDSGVNSHKERVGCITSGVYLVPKSTNHCLVQENWKVFPGDDNGAAAVDLSAMSVIEFQTGVDTGLSLIQKCHAPDCFPKYRWHLWS
jgi:hypothetical protein